MKKLIASTLLALSFSASAFAGTWSNPVDNGSIGSVQNLAASMAAAQGYPNYGATSGSCSTGDVYKYYTAQWTNVGLPGAKRGFLFFHTQYCI